jgi:hypothetical protein
LSTPTDDQYEAVPNIHHPDSPGALPFTGFDVGILFAAGVAIVAAGVVLRRAAHGGGGDNGTA